MQPYPREPGEWEYRRTYSREPGEWRRAQIRAPGPNDRERDLGGVRFHPYGRVGDNPIEQPSEEPQWWPENVEWRPHTPQDDAPVSCTATTPCDQFAEAVRLDHLIYDTAIAPRGPTGPQAGWGFRPRGLGIVDALPVLIARCPWCGRRAPGDPNKAV